VGGWVGGWAEGVGAGYIRGVGGWVFCSGMLLLPPPVPVLPQLLLPPSSPARLAPNCSPRALPACLPAHNIYAGYSTGDPSKRTPGSAISGLTYIALILATAAVGVRTALGA
jgi:hypothetical protein